MIKKTTWSLICKHIIQPLRDTINSSEFIDRHKTSEVAFTRNRVLNFSVIMMFMMNMIKGALQRELDNFFQALNGYDVAVRTITKSAFSAARRKIKETAFTELNSQLIIRWYRTYNARGLPHF